MMKPFSTEETQRILQHLHQPAVFTNMACDWPALQWTAEHLSVCLGDRQIRFRLGRKEEMNTPLFETQCSYVEAELQHFLHWTRGQCGEEVGPFSGFLYSEYWAYADYKYIVMLFQDQPAMFEDVKWCDFGFEGRDGRESTLWIGTEGANTPCHLDSYGYNLVLQVQGRKRWHLFPPDDTAKLYPTRIPYEESSVFSQVNVLCPDLRRFPDFKRARAHVVTLEPGQVLYVPRHWWHYVESVDPITVSINSWIELEADDDVARVSEAVTKAVVCAVKSVRTHDNDDNWLNPTEEGVASHDENMRYLNLAIRACVQRQKKPHRDKVTQAPGDTRPVKRDSGGQIRENSHSRSGRAPFGVPFGLDLVPVRCQQDVSTEAGEVKPSRNQGEKPLEDGAAVSPRTEPASANVGRQHSAGLTRSDGITGTTSEDQEDSIITTNDLLDCLVHPDVITQITKLLLERQGTGHQGTAAPSPSHCCAWKSQ